MYAQNYQELNLPISSYETTGFFNSEKSFPDSGKEKVILINPVIELQLKKGVAKDFGTGNIYKSKMVLKIAANSNGDKICKMYFGSQASLVPRSMKLVKTELEEDQKVKLIKIGVNALDFKEFTNEFQRIGSLVCDNATFVTLPFSWGYNNSRNGLDDNALNEWQKSRTRLEKYLPKAGLYQNIPNNREEIKKNYSKSNSKSKSRKKIKATKNFDELLGLHFEQKDRFWYFKNQNIPLLVDLKKVHSKGDIAILIDQSESFFDVMERAFWTIHAIKLLHPDRTIHFLGMGKKGKLIGEIAKDECDNFKKCASFLTEFINLPENSTFFKLHNKKKPRYMKYSRDEQIDYYDDFIYPSLSAAQTIDGVTDIIVLSDAMFAELDGLVYQALESGLFFILYDLKELIDVVKFHQSQNFKIYEYSKRQESIKNIKQAEEELLKTLNKVKLKHGNTFQDRFLLLHQYFADYEIDRDINFLYKFQKSAEFFKNNYEKLLFDEEYRQIFSSCSICQFYIFKTMANRTHRISIIQNLSKSPLY